MSPDVNDPAFRALTFDVLEAAYIEQMEALLEGGVDAILIETIFDTLNAKAAIRAAELSMQKTGRKVPLMLSVTVSDVAGRTLSGQTLDAFLASVQHADIFSIGLNCSFGAKQLKPFLEQLARRAPYYISAYPNAGLPNTLLLYLQYQLSCRIKMTLSYFFVTARDLIFFHLGDSGLHRCLVSVWEPESHPLYL